MDYLKSQSFHMLTAAFLWQTAKPNIPVRREVLECIRYPVYVTLRHQQHTYIGQTKQFQSLSQT